MIYNAMCFFAYHAHAVLHWAAFKLLPYAGEWAHRSDREKGEE